MRKLGVFVILVAALVMVASLSWADIVGSKHDLSASGYGSTQLCIYCHTPHNAKTPQLAPLWNHASTAATYTLYSSSSLNAVPGQPAGTSKACLSCHDGTVAVDSYGSQTGTHFVAGNALLGTDLSNDHPVSFTYDTALATADGGLVTPASASLVVANVPLYSSMLECASCHNVHRTAGVSMFLRMDNAGSALCRSCHTK